MRRYLTALICVSLFAGCTRANPNYDANPALPDECRAGEESRETFAPRQPEKLDVLFVVDASGDDPAAVQELFANAVAPMGAVLDALELDVRFAVSVTDASIAGLSAPGLTGPDCASNDTQVVELGKNGWDDALRCNLFAADSPEAYDQPLQVVTNLLESPSDDFLRDDARLFVVIATRGDDCSSSGSLSGDPRDACVAADLRGVRTMVDEWVDAMGSPDALGLAVFAGPPSGLGDTEQRPVCSSTVGSALPGNRLFEATRALEYGSFHSVCTDDVFSPLSAALESFALQGTLTFCPELPLAHEPIEVLRDGDPVPLGATGFTYLGETESCENGGLRFAASSLDRVDELEVTYCTESSER